MERCLGEHLRREIAALQSGFGIFRLRLTGTSAIGWQLRRDIDRWRETAELVAGEDERAFIESLAFDLAQSPATAGVADAAGELQAMMDQIAQEEGFRQEAREEVRRMLEALPRDRRMALAADEAGEEALARSIAASAAKAMGARIRGASGGAR